MGWFIAQSLAFIIIAALIGLAIGIWIGWIVWGRRAKGKHTAENARAGKSDATTSEAAGSDATGSDATDSDATGSGAEAGEAAETPAETDRGAVHALAVAATADEERAAGGPDGAARGGEPAAEGGSLAVDGGEPGVDASARTDGPEAAADGGPADAGSADAGSADAGSADADIEDGDADGAGAESDVVAAAEAVAREAAETNAAASEAPAAPGETAASTEAAPQDDLRRIEGIGPKIAAALAAAGYGTYARIAAATETELREAVAGQGIKFAPSATTWADQAQYLADGDEDGLQEYQDYLIGGQERRAKFNKDVDYADVDEIEGAEAKAEAIAQDEAETAAAEAAPEPEPQDLQRIEGIGPKIEAVLKTAGYTTYAKVAGASETELREALAAGGIKFAPAATSWADQAQYLADGDEDGLAEYQDYLIGGQDRHAKFREDVDYTDVDEIEGAEAKAEAIAQDEAETAAAEAADAGTDAAAIIDDDAEPTQPGVKA